MSNFRLWGPPLTPLWGANPRNPRHFSADPHGDLPAKFGEDRPVNKGTLLKKTGLVGPRNSFILRRGTGFSFRACARRRPPAGHLTAPTSRGPGSGGAFFRIFIFLSIARVYLQQLVHARRPKCSLRRLLHTANKRTAAAYTQRAFFQ